MRLLHLVLSAFVTIGSAGCSVGESADDTDGDNGADVGDPEPLIPADDYRDGEVPGTHTDGELARVCNATALNQRSGAGAEHPVVKVIPGGSTVKVIATSGAWVQNEWSGSTGWSSGQYLCPLTDTTPTPPTDGEGFASTAITRTSFLSIASAAVGFSYYWGGGRLAEGANPGSCSGGCPDCTHTGSYGADCSGFIGKAWLLPASLPMDANKHPYSTADFIENGPLWSIVSRSSLQPGDALVYRAGGGGHMVMYEKDDPWGSFWSYEARGCSYGIVHNIRTAGSEYKAIRRDGV